MTIDLSDAAEKETRIIGKPDDNDTLLKLAEGLPSNSKAKADALKHAKRVQFAFSNVPEPIKKAFAKEASKRKITQKELLYACLRAGGVEIPDSQEIDGRRR